MSVSPVEVSEFAAPPRRHLHVIGTPSPETEALPESSALQELADSVVRLHLHACHARQHTPEACVFDPIEGIRVLKYHLIGDPHPTRRLNSHYPPGVERSNAHGERRVYGVECAAKIDPRTGEIIIVRKDDVVGSGEADDWMIALYNPVTGDFREKTALTTHTAYDPVGGDVVTLQLDLLNSPSDYMKAPSTVVIRMSPTYHALETVERFTPKYYGRGTGSQPEVWDEGRYSGDFYQLYTAVCASLEEYGISPDILDTAVSDEQQSIHNARQLGNRAIS